MDDSEDRIVFIFTTMIVLVAVVLAILALMIIYRKRKVQHFQEIASIHEKFQRELLQKQLEVKQQTLQYVSMEIHDNLGLVANLIKMNLNTLTLDDPEAAHIKIEEIKNLIKKLITGQKSLSLSLDSDRIARVGIVQMIKNEIDRLKEIKLFETMLLVEGSVPELKNASTIILYRMSQEILNNAIKHSQAKQMTISLKATEDLFTLVFRDDGIGFDTRQEKNNSGSGLINLHTRANAINSKLLIQSAPGEGTQISIELAI